jgi:hypothetical protein
MLNHDMFSEVFIVLLGPALDCVSSNRLPLAIALNTAIIFGLIATLPLLPKLIRGLTKSHRLSDVDS